jgi:hypothetical protein
MKPAAPAPREAASIIQETRMPFDVQPSSWDRDEPYEPAGVPSAEALRAMRVAARVARELHESGRELRFTLGPSALRVEVLLCDIDGMVLSRMTPARALDIAAGSPVVRGIR